MTAKLLFYIPVLLVLCQLFYEAATQQCSVAESSIYGMTLRGHVFKTITEASGGNVCLLECYREVRCQSYNYVISKRMCELNNRTKEARPEDFVPGPHRYYFRRDLNRVPLGTIPELPAESCEEINASEGGQAVSGKYWLDSIIPEKAVLAHCETGVCPNNWVDMQGSCYKFFSTALNWNASKSACEKFGSKLVVINSQAEQQALGSKIPDAQLTWIGLYRDPNNESHWLWVDGTRPTYTHWDTGEPNNVQEKCTHMNPKVQGWKWNDLRCTGSLPYICETLIVSGCAQKYKSGQRISRVYAIDPDRAGAFNVFCDHTTAGGGWTVFQKRLDGSVDFFLGWDDYKRGFGNLAGEFWLGLDKIHRLTNSSKYKLRVDLEDMSGNTAYAEYDLFAVGSEGTKYQLSLGNYTGTAGDSLAYHNGYPFTTKDRDNDFRASTNCAVQYKGAWWYYGCYNSNLNGVYSHGQNSGDDSVKWKIFSSYSVKRAEMKIRPVDF